MKTSAKQCFATLLFVAMQISVFAESEEQNAGGLFADWISYVVPLLAVAGIVFFTWLSCREKTGNKKHAG